MGGEIDNEKWDDTAWRAPKLFEAELGSVALDPNSLTKDESDDTTSEKPKVIDWGN